MTCEMPWSVFRKKQELEIPMIFWMNVKSYAHDLNLCWNIVKLFCLCLIICYYQKNRFGHVVIKPVDWTTKNKAWLWISLFFGDYHFFKKKYFYHRPVPKNPSCRNPRAYVFLMVMLPGSLKFCHNSEKS